MKCIISAPVASKIIIAFKQVSQISPIGHLLSLCCRARLNEDVQTNSALFVSRATAFTLWGNQPLNGLHIVVYQAGKEEGILTYKKTAHFNFNQTVYG